MRADCYVQTTGRGPLESSRTSRVLIALRAATLTPAASRLGCHLPS